MGRITQDLTVNKKELNIQEDDADTGIMNIEDTSAKLRVFKCVSCGNQYSSQTKFFSPSHSHWYEGNNFFLPVCMKCIDKEFIKLQKKFRSPDEAYRRLCMQWDIYYHPNIVKTSETYATHNNKFSYYCKKACDTKYDNKTYDDTIIEENKSTILSAEENEFDHFYNSDSHDEKKSVEFWGYCFTPKEYSYLNNRYAEWINSYECKNKGQETVFKNICILDLQIQRALAEDKPTDSLYKQMNEWMSSGKIQPKQYNDNALSETQTFGTLIRTWEDHDPIPGPKDEWKDVDGIKKYISVWFLGHLCKMLGLKNEWSDMYEEEIEKNTVRPRNVIDDDGASFDEVFGSLT